MKALVSKYTDTFSLRVTFGLIAEILFVLFPLAVTFILLLLLNKPASVFSSPEWSVGSIILFGQAIVKFVIGASRAGRLASGPLALMITLIVLFGLLPSSSILVFVSLWQEEHRPLTQWIGALQTFMFVISAISYLVVGLVGETLSKEVEAV